MTTPASIINHEHGGTNYFDGVLSWAVDLEPEARAQAIRAAAMPFVERPLALMPDAHYGIGATVGSVIATRGAIIPAAVGVDIGCGMIAVRLGLTSNDLPDNLDGLHRLIGAAIPSGVGKGHNEPVAEYATLPTYFGEMTEKQSKAARLQLGTLGSGNHFVEVCLDEKDRVWLVLHSGSRGIGNQLATIHIGKAKSLMKQYFVWLEDPDLAYFVEQTPAFKAYIDDMHWAQAYAMTNRSVMMSAAVKAMTMIVGDTFNVRESINCHHNFTQQENHHGQNLWVTRKGAIKASVGDKGVIPGSMGTSSYIVSGLGNPASYESCSHGAGRRMSRTRARKEISEMTFEMQMKDKSWNRNDLKTLLDEAPDAYKDIDVVMEAQRDLVRIDHTLHQILNYKGV
jgi:tRNA-splicing ligase RtcB (3'-phosphate/5'-hydroxy nucleic acid ligase)